MMHSHMMWNSTMRNARVTAQGSAAGAPARGLWGRIARMAAVAGTCAMVLFGHGIDAGAGAQEPVAISRLARVEEAVRCQVVFISESEEERVPGIVDYLAGRPVLTVCDAPGCTRFRGIIHLRIVSERIRFAIDIDSAKSAGLKLSSKLLALAEKFARKTETQVSQHRSSD